MRRLYEAPQLEIEMFTTQVDCATPSIQDPGIEGGGNEVTTDPDGEPF